MKKIIFILISTVAFTSCRTNLVFMAVTNPAPVSVPNTIKVVGVVNRSLPSNNNKLLNTVHQVLSGETESILKEGSTECIRGLKDALMENDRFSKIRVFDSLNFRNGGGGMFPAPLSWDEVEKICTENKLDALFVLELFDTDLKINPIVPPPPKTNNPLEVLNTIQQTQVRMETTVKTGWRIYDPYNRFVVDEYTLIDNMSFNGSGGSIIAATESLIGRKEAIKKTANKVGHEYAVRILPYRLRVSREYFIRGNTNLKMATRMARTGNWDGAAAIWEKETNSRSHKIAGRACYNMAIINEINGNLDKAIEWAQKGYENHRKKLARKYVNILRNRKFQLERLNSQKQ